MDNFIFKKLCEVGTNDNSILQMKNWGLVTWSNLPCNLWLVVLRVQGRASGPIKCGVIRILYRLPIQTDMPLWVLTLSLVACSVVWQKTTMTLVCHGTVLELSWDATASTLDRSFLWVLHLFLEIMCFQSCHDSGFLPQIQGTTLTTASNLWRHILCCWSCCPLCYWLFLTCQREMTAKWKAGISQSIVIRTAFIIHGMSFEAGVHP